MSEAHEGMVSASRAKAQQAHHFDHTDDPEFETHRPHTQSRWYRFLMEYKFNRALQLLGFSVRGKTCLTVCAGSGMDAEMLARAGADVVALDISAGALLRARERAKTYGVRYGLVVGDAEDLPFRPTAFDLVFVHDGLHHLTQPDRGVSEMARVARKAVVIVEPADALVTRIAVALGLAATREAAGNEVFRFSARSLRSRLHAAGFPHFRSTRYLMKYGHPPADWWHVFDRTPVFVAARCGFLIAVRLAGHFGNKLTAVALRD